MSSFRTRSPRSQIGMTLTEMLVSVVIIGVAVAGLADVMWFNGIWTMRLFNKVDNIYAAKQFTERLERDVRMGHNVGDFLSGYNCYPAPPAVPQYVLTSQTLILQVPAFDAFGFPLLQQAWSTTQPSQPLQSFDTLVYDLQPDPSRPGQYVIELSVFPGISDATDPNPRRSIQKQTILTGIVGPKDSTTGQVSIFQYFDQTSNSYPTPPIPGTAQVVSSAVYNTSGIAVNLELVNRSSSTTQASTIGLRREIFLRNTSSAAQ